jgi:predicted nuclease of restriction endonuclease-like (RecB) superfamily
MKSDLFIEISEFIELSKQTVRVQANSVLTALFWKIGQRIRQEVLAEKRAAYGQEIVVSLSKKLVERYGRNFEEKNLRRMVQFAEQFEDDNFVVTLSRQLTWSHILVILPLKNSTARNYYIHQTSQQSWGVRELRRQIQLKSFERTEIANAQIGDGMMVPLNTFKDPYLLDFLGLKNTYLETDLENAILVQLEQFILELGKGFAFVERQKRMIIDGSDYYLDLLFYNRQIKRLVAIELKLGKFEASHKGQMELYLKWLNKYEKQEGENHPIGLILCAESSKEQIELMELHNDGIVVAEYLTQMPPRREMEKKLKELWAEAKDKNLRLSRTAVA